MSSRGEELDRRDDAAQDDGWTPGPEQELETTIEDELQAAFDRVLADHMNEIQKRG